MNVYFINSEGRYQIYNGSEYSNKKKLNTKESNFQCFKGYEPTEEGLNKYYNDLIEWMKEIEEYIQYTRYKSHEHATMSVFKKYNNNRIYKDWENVDINENEWINSCYNGGLQYFSIFYNKDRPYKGPCYSYDFECHYPTCLKEENLLIPTTKGEEIYLEELPEILETGFYRILINTDHPCIKAVFSFSKKNTYTNTSVNFLRELRDKYGFDIDIHLIKDGKPNAYIYKNVYQTKDIFLNWFKAMYKLKKTYPNNKLIKHLLSSLWGTLTRYNIRKVYNIEKYIDNEKYTLKGLEYVGNRKRYFLLEKNKVGVYSLYRLKPFLTSYSRNKISRMALLNLNSVLRIHTDGIVYIEDVYIKNIYFRPEKRLTGRMEWYGLNNYIKN